MVLKNEFKSSENLYKLFSNESIENMSLPDNLVIITDHGEECDDEVACLLANRLNINTTIIFTYNEPQNEIKKFKDWAALDITSKPVNAKVGTIDLLDNLDNIFKENETNVLLQIGPIHNNDLRFLKNITDKLKSCKSKNIEYEYILQGLQGRTLNSKGDSLEITKIFNDNSSNKNKPWQVVTLRGKASFWFTANALNNLFNKDHTIIDHVIKIGFRNMVGRADPKFGKFIAHLVMAEENGANYMAVKRFVDILHKNNIKQINDFNENNKARADLISKTYFQLLQTAGSENAQLKVENNGTTNNIAGATKSSVLTGYILYSETTLLWLDIPIGIFEPCNECEFIF